MSNIRTVIKKSGADSQRPPSTTSSTGKPQSSQDSFVRHLMDQMADGEKVKQSSYKGSLASEKHFTPQELNKLHLRTNGAGSYKKPITKEELKKIGTGQKTTGGYRQLESGGPSTSSLSYISGTNENPQQFMSSSKGMSQEQQTRLKNLTSRPFSVKSTSRPGTASSQVDPNQKENEYTIEDDVYEEISIPDVDFEERMKLLKQLEKRDKDREELELENVFEELKKKARDFNNDELETLTNVSMQEIKEEKKVNIYKPTLKGAKPVMQQQNFYPSLQDQPLYEDSTDRIRLPPQPSFLQQSIMQSSKLPTSLVPLPTGTDGQSRLDHIYKQLKELQQFKDEIMDDLDEFMDDVETKSLITIPEQQFDEVVDIIAQESRERGEQVVELLEQNKNPDDEAAEILDENGKPFWMKFFKADYLGETAETQGKTMGKTTTKTNQKEQQTRVNDILQKQEKIRREFEKIRKLDAELAQKTKFQRELKNAQMARKQEEEEQQRRIMELANPPKQPKKAEEDKKKGVKSSKPSTQNTKQRQTTVEEEDDGGDTFLTDVLHKKRSGSQASAAKKKVTKAQKIEEEEDEVDSDEYQDVVYDYEQTQAMMEVADEFLHQPLLSLPAPGDDLSSNKKFNQSQMSFKSSMTSQSSKNFMQLNKDRAANFNPYKKPMICDQLDEASKSRLERLTEDIDHDLDDFIKKKEEFYAIEMEKSQFGGKAPDADNAYLYSKDDVDRIEKINESLRKVAPMLPPADTEDDTNYKPSYDQSKFLSSHQDDKQSMRSLPMSTITRKSQVTMLTHGTINNAALPRDRKLREAAQDRMMKAQMREIEANLRKITESDDLSYATPAKVDGPNGALGDSKGFRDLVQPRKLIDNETLSRLIEECREEEERYSIMSEMQAEYQPKQVDENRLMLRSAAQSERSMRELAKLDDQERRFQQAEELFEDLEQTKDRYLQVLDTVNERQKSINQLETHVNKLLKASESQLSKRKKKDALKTKLTEFEEEIKNIITNLEGKEHLLAVIQEQEQRLESDFEANLNAQGQIKSSSVASTVNDDEGDQKLQKVLRDIEEYNHLQSQIEQEERDRNNNILEQVMAVQVGRNDQENAMERFALEQLEIYRRELEKEAQQNQ